MNHTRARSLASPSRAEAEGVGVGVGVAWRGAARRAAAGRAVRVHGAAERDVTCKCSAVRCDVMC